MGGTGAGEDAGVVGRLRMELAGVTGLGGTAAGRFGTGEAGDAGAAGLLKTELIGAAGLLKTELTGAAGLLMELAGAAGRFKIGDG